MLYHGDQQCDCECHKVVNAVCSKCMIDDGVEPVGMIDWFNPVMYGWLCRENAEWAAAYRDKWQRAYAARGWEFKH